jgi:Xaa-Pro aminopeptidase
MEVLFQQRLKALRDAFVERGIDTLMVMTAENRRFLSGFTGEDTQFDETAGALFIGSDKLLLATDSRYDLQARAEAPLYEIYCYRESLDKALPEILHMLEPERVGFESSRMSYSRFQSFLDQTKCCSPAIEWVPVKEAVEALRIRKSETEIQMIRDALVLAEDVFRSVVRTVRPGDRERDIAWRIEKGMRESGAESVSFPTIVASGSNSALPHAIPGNRPFKIGEPLLFDWGAKLSGYCSDITRTICIGKPDPVFQKVFQTVQEAQQKAIEAIRPGISTKQIDGIARRHIEENGYRDRFGHGLGHGVGLAIHEDPRLSPRSDRLLEPGMVCTVEPGIYIPEWGGVRLENMVVVRENGAEVLNSLEVLDSYNGA